MEAITYNEVVIRGEEMRKRMPRVRGKTLDTGT